jgi:hypothetical protein
MVCSLTNQHHIPMDVRFPITKIGTNKVYRLITVVTTGIYPSTYHLSTTTIDRAWMSKWMCPTAIVDPLQIIRTFFKLM